MPVDYEVEYDNRARVPNIRRSSHAGSARPLVSRGRTKHKIRHRIWPLDAPIHGYFSSQGRRQGAACNVHPWRLVALARAPNSPIGGGSERSRYYSRGRWLRPLPELLDRRHHRTDARRLSLSLAQTPPAHLCLRTFRRRPSCGVHGGNGLEGDRARRARRSRARSLCDLGSVRSLAACARVAER